MADGRSIGDNASTAASTQPGAFHHQDSTELSTVINNWREKAGQSLQVLREKVNHVTHGNTSEKVAVTALALGAVAVDIASHGALHKAAQELSPELKGILGFTGKLEPIAARTGTAIDKIAARDSSNIADQIFNHKPKSVSINDLQGWKEIELQNSIRGDKVVRGFTADFREAKGAHTQVNQELNIATRDQTQLSTELKALKQLRSESVDSPLTTESSPALKKIRSAQQNSIDAATSGTAEERESARRSVTLAKENFERARAAAPTRIEQIEGVEGKPGLLPRVNDHIAALQEKATGHIDFIADIAAKAQARMDALKETRAFEAPTSAEDQAFRKREQAATAIKPAQSILTAEERTGIAAPPPKPVVEAAKPVAAEKPAATIIDRPAPQATFKPATTPNLERPVAPPIAAKVEPATPVRANTTPSEVADPRRPVPQFNFTDVQKDVKVDSPLKKFEQSNASFVRETSGYATIDNTYAAALTKADSFRANDGKASLRSSLISINEYAKSVSEVLRTELDADKRELVVKNAVRDLEHLMQPFSPGGKVVVDSAQALDPNKRLLGLTTTIEKRLAGIERGIAERAAASQGTEKNVEKSTEDPVAKPVAEQQFSQKTRAAIDAFKQVQNEIPKDAKIYAVRTDGTIVDTSLASSREPGVTRTVPKRVEATQISDLGAQSVLGRHFGKFNDIGYFVVVESKRDAHGAVVIANAAEVAEAKAAGRAPVNPIPDQVVSRIVGSAPNNAFKPGSSFKDFYKKFNQQKERAAAAAAS